MVMPQIDLARNPPHLLCSSAVHPEMLRDESSSLSRFAECGYHERRPHGGAAKGLAKTGNREPGTGKLRN